MPGICPDTTNWPSAENGGSEVSFRDDAPADTTAGTQPTLIMETIYVFIYLFYYRTYDSEILYVDVKDESKTVFRGNFFRTPRIQVFFDQKIYIYIYIYKSSSRWLLKLEHCGLCHSKAHTLLYNSSVADFLILKSIDRNIEKFKYIAHCGANACKKVYGICNPVEISKIGPRRISQGCKTFWNAENRKVR